MADDSVFRRLSRQIFGRRGPFVNLSEAETLWQKKENDHLRTVQQTNNDSIKEEIETGGLVYDRCLICHSNVTQEERWRWGEGQESGQLIEFLTITIKSLSTSEKLDAIKQFEKEVGRLSSTRSRTCLCQICSLVLKKLSSKQQAILQLQEAVNELRQKIIAVIRLSRALSKETSINSNGDSPVDYCGDDWHSANDSRDGDIKSPESENDILFDNESGEKTTELDDDTSMSAQVIAASPPISANIIDEKRLRMVGQAREWRRRLKEMFPNLNYREALAARRKLKGAKFFTKRRLNSGKGSCGDTHHQCEQCGKKFGRKIGLVRHVKEQHGSSFQCDICGAKLRGRASLIRHKQVQHLGIRPFACDQCEKRFGTKVLLTSHFERQHTERAEGDGCPCDICGTVLTDARNLSRHKLSKHQEAKSHVCKHCGRGFGRKDNLTVHVRTHTGERPYTCKVCSMGFIEKRSLKLHVKRTHEEIVLSPQHGQEQI